MHVVISALDKNKLPPDSQESEKKLSTHCANMDLSDKLSPEIVSTLKFFWDLDVVKQKHRESNIGHVNEMAHYYFDELDRIAADSFIPTDIDILRSRGRTTGISEITYNIQGVNFTLVDVGGQRSERKKWIHCFQDVTCLIFCVAMSEYDMTLIEDDSVNRMHESIMLFEEICNCRWFHDISIILFLNKSDVFSEKITRVDMNTCFPEYTGGCNVKEGTKFVKAKFQSLNHNQTKTIYSHVTNATNTQNIQHVFASVRDVVIRNSLERCGI